MKPSLSTLLSFNAGYIDTAGFLALQGLFTAHVTGNFVTLGASLALGSSGAIAKLLALPIFCAVVIATRLLNTWLSERHRPALDALIALKVLLLLIGAALAIRFGPFHDTDGWRAVLTGMVLGATCGPRLRSLPSVRPEHRALKVHHVEPPQRRRAAASALASVL
jgi:uncharacterized membrane protein YoaK (UPF0700 family)